MREPRFLTSNAPRWQAFEEEFKRDAGADPDKVADQYLRLTDDLAYARTYYPFSNVTRYLNELTAHVHRNIYRSKREKGSKIRQFFEFDLPLASATIRWQILLSFGLFALGLAVGILSASKDDTFPVVAFGEGYVDLTIENIKKGDPLAIYKDEDQTTMFLRIALNNLRVDVTIFALGIIFSFLSGLMIFREGVRLGVFHYLFYQYGVLGENLETVYIHGALEMCGAIIASAAGMHLGTRYLFPGTLPRIVSLRKGATETVKVIFGLFGITLIAAFLESFVTRYTDMPHWLSILIILLSLVLMVGYFVVYPLNLLRRSIVLSPSIDASTIRA